MCNTECCQVVNKAPLFDASLLSPSNPAHQLLQHTSFACLRAVVQDSGSYTVLAALTDAEVSTSVFRLLTSEDFAITAERLWFG